MSNLTTCTDDELQAEVRRRQGLRLSEIGKDRYHPRREVCEIVSQLRRDKVLYKYQAVTICGAKVWLDYHEYANACGGEVWNVMVEVNGEEFSKNITEAMCLDIEVGKWLSWHKEAA
jgi:hypothetical protein